MRLTARQQIERKRLLDLFISIPGRDRNDNCVTSAVSSSAPHRKHPHRQPKHPPSFLVFASPLSSKYDCNWHDRSRKGQKSSFRFVCLVCMPRRSEMGFLGTRSNERPWDTRRSAEFWECEAESPRLEDESTMAHALWGK